MEPMEDEDFFEIGNCDNCGEIAELGCWDGWWICQDCYIDDMLEEE